MENLPDALSAMPQLAPGLLLGALAGIGYGLFEDHKADDGIPQRWWQYGGLGVILGGLAWIVLINIS